MFSLFASCISSKCPAHPSIALYLASLKGSTDGLTEKLKPSLCKFIAFPRSPRERYPPSRPLHIESWYIVVDDQMIVLIQGRQTGLGSANRAYRRRSPCLASYQRRNRIILFFGTAYRPTSEQTGRRCFVPVCGLKTFPCKRRRQRECGSALQYIPERPIGAVIEPPCGRTTAMRPPGFRKFRLRSIKRISLQ